MDKARLFAILDEGMNRRTAIVESQHYSSGGAQPACDAVDRFGVHGPAMLRVRMAHQGRFPRLAVFRFFQQSFQASGGTVQKQGFDLARH